MSTHQSNARGFTLVEALVAIAILAFVVLGFLGVRTGAMVDAAGARDLRIARNFAHQKLSELLAGAVEIAPESGVRQPIDDYPHFYYAFFIGEGEVAQAADSFAEEFADEDSYDRLQWQRERNKLRRAEQAGVSIYDYEDQLLADESEPRVPSEFDFEEVAISIYYPNRKLGADRTEFVFTLKTRVTTAAIEGLTPERAETIAQSRGEDAESATTSGAHRHPNDIEQTSTEDGGTGASTADPSGLGQ